MSILLFGTICLIIFSVLTKQNNNISNNINNNYYNNKYNNINIVNINKYKNNNISINYNFYSINRELVFERKNIWDIRFKKEQKYYDIKLSHEFQDYIRKLCKKYNINMSYIIAIMTVESGFNNNCIHENKNGTVDVGFMQINSACSDYYLKKLNLDNIYDPYQNITVGVYIFYEHLVQFDYNYKYASMTYNTGWKPKYVYENNITSTKYTEKVLKLVDFYENQLN